MSWDTARYYRRALTLAQFAVRNADLAFEIRGFCSAPAQPTTPVPQGPLPGGRADLGPALPPCRFFCGARSQACRVETHLDAWGNNEPQALLNGGPPLLKCSPLEDDELYEVLNGKAGPAGGSPYTVNPDFSPLPGELSCDEYTCVRVLLRNAVPISRRKPGRELDRRPRFPEGVKKMGTAIRFPFAEVLCF